MIKLAFACFVSVIALQGCGKKSSGSSNNGSGNATGVPKPSGHYYSSCVPIPGMTIGGATHTNTLLSFVNNTFSATKFFATDGLCASIAYAGYQTGTFAVGNSVKPPVGGYEITMAITNTYVGIQTVNAQNDLNTGCGTAFGPPPDLMPVFADFNCANIDIFANKNLYNIFVLTNPLLEMGTATGDNPGVDVLGNVSTNMTMMLTK